MRKFFSKILEVLDTMNRARTATYFTRMGRHDLAKAIMLKDDARI